MTNRNQDARPGQGSPQENGASPPANARRLAAGRNAEAEKVLKEGLERHPEIGELQYALGLLLAEEQRMPEAAAGLAKAAELMPQRAKVHYNLGLAFQQLREPERAETSLLAAQHLDARDPSIPYALAILSAPRGKLSSALEWAERAQALAPEDAQLNQFVARLRTHAPAP